MNKIQVRTLACMIALLVSYAGWQVFFKPSSYEDQSKGAISSCLVPPGLSCEALAIIEQDAQRIFQIVIKEAGRNKGEPSVGE